jgi:hypothetical protein
MIPGNANPLLLASAAADAAAAGPIKSVRFDKDSSGHLSRTFGTATDTKKFTISFWVKRVEFSQATYLLTAGTGTQGYLNFDAGIIRFYAVNGDLKTNAVYRDPAAWYHIVAVADTANSTTNDRLQLYVNGVRLTDANGDFSKHTQPSSSATLGDWNSANTHYVNRLSSGNYQSFYMADFYFIDGQAKEATDFGAFDDNGVWQAAVYSGTIGTNGFHLFDFANESGIGNDSSGNDNDWTVNNLTSSSLGDTAGVTTTVPQDVTGDWLGILGVAASDTNGPVAVFPDGGGIANTKGTFYWSGLTSGDTITWYGTASGESSRPVTGNISESTVAVPGASLGSISLTVTAASGSAKIDFNGSANCYGITPGPLSSRYFDDSFDVPTNGTQSDTGAGGEVSGNHAVFNALDTPWTLSNGNLDATAPGTPNRSYCPATIFVNSGKYYVEFTLTNNSTSTSPQVGIVKQGDAQGYIGNTGTSGVGYEPATDRVINAGTSTVPFYNTAFTSAGVVVGLGLDMDAGTLVGYVNGTSIGTLATGLSGYYAFACGDINGAGVPEVVVNFGQRAFAYGNAGTNRPAATYKTLCTTNLPTPTIADGSDYFDAVTYTSDNQASKKLTFGFSPDLFWSKVRNFAEHHVLHDSVRGASKVLKSSNADAESTESSGRGVLSFDSDGVTIGIGSPYNSSGNNSVVWAWDAGSSTVSNTDGTITSSVRANQTAGFSIVSYTGTGSNATVGHNLNAVPELIILKDRDAAKNWAVWHKDLSSNAHYLILNSTDAEANTFPYWNGDHTSSVFTLGTTGGSNESGDDFIAYCFAPVNQYSSFGSYEGNGSSDGPFIFTGHLPRFVIIKRTDASGNDWQLYDTARSTFNEMDDKLKANTNGAEVVEHPIDFLSNGFKPRNTANGSNGSGATYIYASFASNPFQANGGLAR